MLEQINEEILAKFKKISNEMLTQLNFKNTKVINTYDLLLERTNGFGLFSTELLYKKQKRIKYDVEDNAMMFAQIINGEVSFYHLEIDKMVKEARNFIKFNEERRFFFSTVLEYNATTKMYTFFISYLEDTSRRILVTGGLGYIGSSMVSRL
jgi:hypothetical protein